MTEVKCLGFAELLEKQAKTLTEWHKELQKKGEVDCRFCSIVGSKNACSDCTQVLAMQPKWVSVDVLKQWQDQVQKAGVPGRVIRFGIDSMEKVADWKNKHNLEDMKFVPVDLLFSGGFSAEKSPLQEKKECQL